MFFLAVIDIGYREVHLHEPISPLLVDVRSILALGVPISPLLVDVRSILGLGVQISP